MSFPFQRNFHEIGCIKYNKEHKKSIITRENILKKGANAKQGHMTSLSVDIDLQKVLRIALLIYSTNNVFFFCSLI